MMNNLAIEQAHLTQKEQYWHKHIQHAQGSDQSLSEYAELQGLNLKYFYNYRSKLRKKDCLSQIK